MWTHYLVISEPYAVVCNGESEDMVHEGLTLWMVARGGESLQKENVINLKPARST